MKTIHFQQTQPEFKNILFEYKQNGKNRFAIINAKDIGMCSPFPPLRKDDPYFNETQYLLMYQKKADSNVKHSKVIKNGKKYISKYSKKKQLEHEELIAYKKETSIKLNGEDYIFLLLFGAYPKVVH